MIYKEIICCLDMLLLAFFVYIFTVFLYSVFRVSQHHQNLTYACCKYRKGQKSIKMFRHKCDNSLLSMTKIVHLYRFYCPFTPRGPEVPPGRGKNGTFQMAVTQSPMSISKGKTAGQLLILCLINNVGHSFLTFIESL